MNTALTQEEFEKVVEKVKASNPGTELWAGQHPQTLDRWIYRPPTPAEMNIFRKTTRAEIARGDLADYDRANAVYVEACVLWPEKEDVAALLALRPGLRKVMAEKVHEAGGATEEAVVKKL